MAPAAPHAQEPARQVPPQQSGSAAQLWPSALHAHAPASQRPDVQTEASRQGASGGASAQKPSSSSSYERLQIPEQQSDALVQTWPYDVQHCPCKHACPESHRASLVHASPADDAQELASASPEQQSPPATLCAGYSPPGMQAQRPS